MSARKPVRYHVDKRDGKGLGDLRIIGFGAYQIEMERVNERCADVG
jgi:hypothetical protein